MQLSCSTNVFLCVAFPHENVDARAVHIKVRCRTWKSCHLYGVWHQPAARWSFLHYKVRLHLEGWGRIGRKKRKKLLDGVRGSAAVWTAGVLRWCSSNLMLTVALQYSSEEKFSVVIFFWEFEWGDKPYRQHRLFESLSEGINHTVSTVFLRVWVRG